MDLFRQLAKLRESRTTFVLATVVETGGSSPQKAGAKLVLLPDGSILGTIGGGAIEHEVVAAARELLASPDALTRMFQAHLSHDLGMCCGGKMSVFLEKVLPAEQLVIFGAGHVARALAAIARSAGFSVVVADERAEQLNAERFPDAERLLQHPVAAARSLPLDARTMACVMTHDHAIDQEVVEALLRRPLEYLGLIGSRRKSERFRARLEQRGFSAEEIARLRSPVGVAIGAQTPEEIAISIVAELVAIRHGVEVQTAAAAPKKEEQVA